MADALPDSSHVVRYVKPTLVDGDRVDGSAFRLRSEDTGISVNWLEWFANLSKDGRLQEVRRLARIEMRPSGRLAELSVGETLRHVRAVLTALAFAHCPLSAKDGYDPDPSHSQIEGLPSADDPQSALIGDMIAECVQAMHPPRLRRG